MERKVKKLLAVVASIATLTSASMQAGFNTYAYTVADQYVDEAKEHDYIQGRPNEVTDYWGVVGEWCAMYVYYIAVQCGIGDQIGRYSYCDNLSGYNGFRNVYEKKGKFAYRGDYIPKKGDLILFDWGYDGYCDHIGIVTGADSAKWQVYTIEGNVKDKVAYKTYSLSSSNIVGYCQTGLTDQTLDPEEPTTQPNTESTTEATTTETTTESPTEGTTDKVEDDIYNNEVSRFKLTSPIGGWLRQSANYGLKIGIISTGTVLDAVLSKSVGDWVFVQDVPTENGLVSDGFVYKTNIEVIPTEQPTTEQPTTETSPTEATTETTQPNTEAPSTETTPKEDPIEPDNEKHTANYYVSSPIGANARTSPEFGDNIKKVISTNVKVYADSWTNGFAHCQIVDTGEWIYLHNTVIDKIQQAAESDTEQTKPDNTDKDENNENVVNEPTHYVSSPIGCNMRAIGSYSGKLIRILDTYQKITVLENKNSAGYIYCEAEVAGVGTLKGYVISTAITKLQ